MSTMEYSHQQHQHTRMKQIVGQLHQTRSDLKRKEDYVVSLIQSMGEMKGQLNQTRSDLKQKQGEVESLIQKSDPKHGERMESLSNSGTEMEHSHQQHHQDLRMKEMEGHLDYMRSALEHKEKEVESLSNSIGQMEDQLKKTRSALEHKEKEVESLSNRVTEMKHSHQQQHQDLRMKEMEGHLDYMRSALEHKEKEVESLSNRLKEKEEEHRQTRSALKEKDKELQSFKDRVAADVTLSMKTGKTFESMNNPVNRARLKEMYEELWMEWPKIKKYLRSNQDNPEAVKQQIQEKFKSAMLAMEKKKQQIDKVFGLDEANRGSASEKVQQYRESTCQNLQLALYHKKKEDADLKTPSSGQEGGKPQDVKESSSGNEGGKCQDVKESSSGYEGGKLQDVKESSSGHEGGKRQDVKESSSGYEGGKLQDVKESSSGYEGGKLQDGKEYWSSKCYWLGCLMALNNPPLQPDWENHPQSMDKWDLFPRNLTAASGK